ncbi:hypothetical protein SDC9_197389 [bioreactor metagenome]|uniref:Uncharacterized protein n=1 Tax=bioreactor metagenome TaxID=1076179 RepID=A0A645IEQ9_9ZZZZ
MVDLADHMGDTRARQVVAKVRRHALLQVLSLADVEHGAVGADHPVDARQFGQGSEEGF